MEKVSAELMDHGIHPCRELMSPVFSSINIFENLKIDIFYLTHTYILLLYYLSIIKIIVFYHGIIINLGDACYFITDSH